MKKTITQSVYNQANNLLNQGRVVEAWQALADGGDNYAANAAIVSNKESEDFNAITVRETWKNTAGENVYNESFDDVAIMHLTNYLTLINEAEKNGKVPYQLPTTTEIETSYASALDSAGVSRDVAIDGIINAAEIGHWAGWLDLFDGNVSDVHDIDPDRVTGDHDISSSYSRVEAVGKILQIGFESGLSYGVDEKDIYDSIKNYAKDRYGDIQDFFSNLFGKEIEDQQSHIPQSEINNNLLNLTINTDQNQDFRPSSDPTQVGNAIDGGDYFIESDIDVLNGDGVQNTTPMGILTDQYRPGNSELSDQIDFVDRKIIAFI